MFKYLFLAIALVAGSVQASPEVEEVLREVVTDNRQVQCLANNIYHEARNQSDTGQYAVALVTLNRVESPRFPNTVCRVVHQAVRDSSGAPIRHKCQFSWYCDGRSDRIAEPLAFAKALDIAEDVYFGRVEDFTNNATFYHTRSVNPDWAKVFNVVYEHQYHIFYRP